VFDQMFQDRLNGRILLSLLQNLRTEGFSGPEIGQ
jgi:hypothetical protein